MIANTLSATLITITSVVPPGIAGKPDQALTKSPAIMIAVRTSAIVIGVLKGADGWRASVSERMRHKAKVGTNTAKAIIRRGAPLEIMVTVSPCPLRLGARARMGGDRLMVFGERAPRHGWQRRRGFQAWAPT